MEVTMAESHHLPSHPGPKAQIVRADVGSWISGACLPIPGPGIEAVTAAQIRKGDIIEHHGRYLVVAGAPVRCWYYENGQRVVGVEIVCRDGNARWCLYRAHGEIVHRLSDGAL
jgi:hypothetical protein